ncbi:hypothetical protein [Candidatus Nitrospira bockiana]
MDKDAILLAGTVAGFVAALLTITERVLNLRDRLRQNDEDQGAARRDPSPEPLPRRPQPAWKLLNLSSYLLLHELSVIIATGVLLNYLGLLLSLRLQSILYLDMIGTAFSALLLGPWWGALVALLSSSAVNWLLFPASGADVLIYPWVLVNMAGGLFWGVMARRTAFRKYLKTPRSSALAHAGYLLTFGLLGALVMAVPGVCIQAALAAPAVFALDPGVARALETMIMAWQAGFQERLSAIVGTAWGDTVGWGVLNWIQTSLRYVPDKTISVAIALTVIKYGFPLFERELLHGQGKQRLRDTAAAPLLLGALYAPAFLGLLLADTHAGLDYWPLWSAPWVVILGGLVLLHRWGPSDEEARRACLARAERYAQTLRSARREPAHDFGQRLTVATLIASLLFALSLPAVLADFYQAAFNFFCVVYGFLLAIYLVRVAISQNLSMARLEK